MKRLFLAFFVFCYSYGFTQSITRENILGSWICKGVRATDSINISKEERGYLDVMLKAFINSKFTFGATNIFTIQFSKDVPKKIVEGLYFINKKEWSLDTTANTIHIGKPRENIMQIIVKKNETGLLFDLYETPLRLEMEKLQ